ncbi:MAG: ribonuclease P protein component [Balneolaceae bacterium]
MKKGRNNISDLNESDFSLPRSRILRGKKKFQRLFNKSTVISANSVQLRYRVYKNPDENCLAGFVVAKKLGNAVSRNKTKRRMREIYRLNQGMFDDLFSASNFGIHFVFIAKSVSIPFATLRKDMISVMQKLRVKLTDKEQKNSFTSSQ